MTGKHKQDLSEKELNEIIEELETPTQEELRKALQESDANDPSTEELL